MKSMRKIVLLAWFISALLLTGCGSTPAPQTTPETFPVETFVSQRLGISFNFIDEQSDGKPLYGTPTILLSGDSISVSSQTLQVLKKDPNISAEEFVESLFNTFKDDCVFKIETFAATSPLMTGYQKISLRNASAPNFVWLGDVNIHVDNHCNDPYGSAFGAVYFVYNPTVPGKILLLNLGQDGSIKWTDVLPWVDTIHIF